MGSARTRREFRFGVAIKVVVFVDWMFLALAEVSTAVTLDAVVAVVIDTASLSDLRGSLGRRSRRDLRGSRGTLSYPGFLGEAGQVSRDSSRCGCLGGAIRLIVRLHSDDQRDEEPYEVDVTVFGT